MAVVWALDRVHVHHVHAEATSARLRLDHPPVANAAGLTRTHPARRDRGAAGLEDRHVFGACGRKTLVELGLELRAQRLAGDAAGDVGDQLAKPFGAHFRVSFGRA